MRNLRGPHRQSILGYAWLLVPPLVTTAVWTGLNKTGVLPVGPTPVPYPLYVLTGLMLWSVFVEALKCPINDLRMAREILVKVRIPHEAVLLAGVGGIIFNLLIRALLLAGAFIVFGVMPGWSVFLVPFAVLSILMTGLAIGLWLAPVGLLYDDVSRTLDVATAFGFLVTPIVYPLPQHWPASLLGWVNPLVPAMEAARGWLDGSAAWPLPGFFLITLLALLGLVSGWLVYRVAMPHILARM